MKVVVFLSGWIDQGLDSPTSGEGRWGQNLAKMLARKGHEVDCVAGAWYRPPTWGNADKYPNVTLMNQIDSTKLYDLAIYTPWENLDVKDSAGKYGSCLTLPLKAKWSAHCTFGWGDSIHTDHVCYNHNHILVYPYIQDEAQFPPTGPRNGFPTFALPIPVFKEFAQINLQKRTAILWTCKGVFHPDWPDGHHVPKLGIRTLNALKRLASKTNFYSFFLDGQYFQQSPLAKKLGVMDIVNSIPNAQLISGVLPLRDYLDLLSRGRVTSIVSGLLGSFAESIAMGSVPLCYDGHIYRASADNFKIKLDTYDASEDAIYDCIERLFLDDVFYSQVLDAYRHEIRYHKEDTVYYQYFVPMARSLGLMEK